MNLQQQRDFLTKVAYWSIVAGAAYLAFEYLLPIVMPFVFGLLIAWPVMGISRKLRCSHKLFRIGLTAVIYGIIGLLVSWLIVQGVSNISDIIRWLPRVYENKLLPLVELGYTWARQTIQVLDPALVSALEVVLESLLASLKTLLSFLSGQAVDLVSALAVGIPDLILRLLAMIFSTVFLVGDYERIVAFAQEKTPDNLKKILTNVRIYLTDTLFVVIRSYAIIMCLTFTELSILFSLFGIEHALLKAGIIALLDIMPVLGTGGIMIPWAIISLVLGYTKLGLQLFLIYAIVTIVRNYVEPRIVGTQLGLHPIITLVAMFIGLRLFGFWGLFGLPVGISFLWKQKLEQNQKTDSE